MGGVIYLCVIYLARCIYVALCHTNVRCVFYLVHIAYTYYLMNTWSLYADEVASLRPEEALQIPISVRSADDYELLFEEDATR